MNLQAFHFEQPLWLLALLPALVIVIVLWRQQSQHGNWQSVVDADLLPYLLSGRSQQQYNALRILCCGWLLAILALAGPSWEKLPQPLMQKQDGLVILLDLSYSMYAEDIQPSRLIRVRQKILDLLKKRKEGVTGMVSYAGDAHIVSPMTDDVATIANLIPALEPAIMPAFGSNPAAAVKTALELFNNSGLKRGRILLIGDALTDSDIDAINTQLNGTAFELSLLAVGTAQGAPIPFENGFVRNRDGSIVLPGLTLAQFETLANKTSARLSEIQLDDSDLKKLLAETPADENELKSVERNSDQWRNRGPWLVMLLLPLAALAFRRGWLIALAGIVLFQQPNTAQAIEWQDLWQTRDQQAKEQLNRGDAANAAETFDNPRWKANAFYQAGDYAKALEALSSPAINDSEKTADDFYNQGNALARTGKLDDAIVAFDKSLEINPANEDAKANKTLLQKLKEQQKNQPQISPQEQKSQKEPQSGEQKQPNQPQQNSADNGQQHQQKNQQQNNNSSSSSDQQNNQDPNFDDQAKQDQQNRQQQMKEQQAKEQKTKERQAEQSSTQADKKNNADKTEKPEQQTAQQKTQQQQATEDKQPTAEELQKLQQQQATEQWLRQIPDDPGGLMQRKFRYEYEQRRRQGETGSGNQQPW